MSLQLLHLNCYVHWGSQRRFVYTASHPSSSLWQALASSQQTTLLPGILRRLVCVGGIVNSTCFTTILSLTKHYLYMTSSLAGILILSSLLRYGKILGLTLVWLGHCCVVVSLLLHIILTLWFKSCLYLLSPLLKEFFFFLHWLVLSRCRWFWFSTCQKLTLSSVLGCLSCLSSLPPWGRQCPSL